MNRTTPLSLLFRILVGGVLIYAGFIKAVRPSAEFAAIIAAYRVAPTGVITYLAMALPYLEMWIGLFVLFGLFPRQAAMAACSVFSVFFVVLLATMMRGIDLSTCGCFGPDSLSPRVTILIDVSMILLSWLLYRMNKYPQSLTLDDLLS